MDIKKQMSLTVNNEYQELYEMVAKEIGKEEAEKIMKYKFFSAWGFQPGGHWVSDVLRKTVYKMIQKNPNLSDQVKQKAKDWYEEKTSSWFWLIVWVIIVGLFLTIYLLK